MHVNNLHSKPVTTTYILDTATPLTMLLAESTGGSAPRAPTTRYCHGLDTLAQFNGTTTETFGLLRQ